MAFVTKVVLCLAAALPVRSYSIVRQEKAHVKLQVDADGKMVEVGRQEQAPSMCRNDYPLGTEGSNNCSHPADSEILQREECLDAARNAKVYAGTLTFTLETDSFQKHPQGCFKIKCSEAHHATVANNLTNQPGDCYFYNPIGYKPDQTPAGVLKGEPVCQRKRVTKGTKNENGGCEEHYEVITNEYRCKDEAACLSYCIGQEFRDDVKNASKYNDFPSGCFIHNGDGCVYFNQPPPNWSKKPTGPNGINLCSVNIADYTAPDVTGAAAAAAASPAGNGTNTEAAAAEPQSQKTHRHGKGNGTSGR